MVAASLETDDRRLHRYACPRCGGTTYRVHRHLLDRFVGTLYRARRYRCKESDCGWEGLLTTPARGGSPRALARSPAAWFAAALVLLPVVAMAIVAYRVYSHKPLVPAAFARWVASMSVAGNRAPSSSSPVALATNSGCVWEGPGRQRFMGTFPEALAAAGLPGDVVGKLAAMHDGNLASDRLEISSAGIRTMDHRRNFGYTTKAMALGDAVCLNTSVNIPVGIKGTADLYELTDQNGYRYLVMSVSRGENVAVLMEQSER